MKILLAGVLGGIVMFVWTSIAHMALPLGEAGINEIPNESAVLSAMQSSIGDKTGLYIFPGLGVGKNATREENDLRGEKFTAPINRTKTYFVNPLAEGSILLPNFSPVSHPFRV